MKDMMILRIKRIKVAPLCCSLFSLQDQPHRKMLGSSKKYASIIPCWVEEKVDWTQSESPTFAITSEKSVVICLF